jgi:hypothetical protein
VCISEYGVEVLEAVWAERFAWLNVKFRGRLAPKSAREVLSRKKVDSFSQGG